MTLYNTRRWLASLLILIGLSDFIMAEAQHDGTPRDNAKISIENLFKQTGTDPSFESLLKDGKIPEGTNSTEGMKGSTIAINKAIVEQGPNSTNPIPKDLKIHTLCNSSIPRKDFPKWTRWYQEDGNTQIFRLFTGEHNVRNSRAEAARIEAFSALSWEQGDWHEWEGTYTIVKPHACCIFQVMSGGGDEWPVHIDMNDDGDIILNHRRIQADKVIAQKMTGKSFNIKARDNGLNYEIYLNGKKEGEGSYERRGKTDFRWGMYDHTLKHDAMIFVTGATFK
jgi:hypothetical protein